MDTVLFWKDKEFGCNPSVVYCKFFRAIFNNPIIRLLSLEIYSLLFLTILQKVLLSL